eukprot:SAG22_NODE_1_length_62449_cov_158.689270_14_plen_81_part_00
MVSDCNDVCALLIVAVCIIFVACDSLIAELRLGFANWKASREMMASETRAVELRQRVEQLEQVVSYEVEENVRRQLHGES